MMSTTGEVRHTICRLCSACCPVTVRVADEKIVSAQMKHAEFLEAGYTCPKLQHAADIIYSERRVLYPQYRAAGDADAPWLRISWDQAVQQISRTLGEIRIKYGARSLCWLRGQAADWGSPWHYVMRFMHAFGSPNAIGNGSVCHAAREMNHVYTYGAMTNPDYANAECIVVWGKNERNTGPVQYDELLRAQARGAKLVVVDPVRTELARTADIWLQIRPGCDGILALTMMNVIIEEKLYDESFIRDWAIGFEDLEKIVRRYPPADTAEKIGLKAEKIVETARLYAGHSPACIAEGNGIDMSINTSQNTRAICILRALTGNLDRKGGDLLPTAVPFKDITLGERLAPDALSIAHEYPLFNVYHRDRGIQTLGPLLDAILEEKPYPIKAMIIQGANPAVTSVNTKRFLQAMKKLEFVVLIDLFETKTAATADMLLPTTSCFEKTQLNLSSLSGTRVILQDRVIDSLGESRPDWWIVFELARSLGYEREFPWKTVEEAIDDQLQPAGITTAELRRNPDGITIAEKKYQKYRDAGFATESGKVELYSRIFASHGYAPVPDFDLDALHPVGSTGVTDVKDEYPFTAISGERSRYFVHSQLRHIDTLRKEKSEPVADINRADAKSHDIVVGDIIGIETANGTIKMKAKVGDIVKPGFVRIPWGWGEFSETYNLNVLTDDTLKDPITSTTSNRTFRCRISKVE